MKIKTGVIFFSLLASTLHAAKPRFAIGGHIGTFDMTNAQKSYNAVYGDPILTVGFDAEMIILKGLAFHLTIETGSVEGRQVILTPNPQPTDQKSTFSMTPIHLTVGYLFGEKKPWSFLAGGGITTVEWSDTNSLRRTSGNSTGFHVLLSIRKEWEKFNVGANLRYSSIPNAIGRGGVSRFYGEDDIGGLSIDIISMYKF